MSVDGLSDQQIADTVALCEEWTRVTASTERCDRPAAEAAVRRAYRVAGLPEPAAVVWLDSPMGGLLMSVLLSNYPHHLHAPAGAPDHRVRLAALLDGRPVPEPPAWWPSTHFLNRVPARLVPPAEAWFHEHGWVNNHVDEEDLSDLDEPRCRGRSWTSRSGNGYRRPRAARCGSTWDPSSAGTRRT